MSREVADNFVAALWELEENENVEPLVEVHRRLRDRQRLGPGDLQRPRRPARVLDELPQYLRRDEIRVPQRHRHRGGAALEWTTTGTPSGDSVSYDGVSILEIEGDKVRRFMAYFDTRDLTRQVVD